MSTADTAPRTPDQMAADVHVHAVIAGEATDYDNCGTYAGWNRHRKDRTRTCDACREAARVYTANYRAARPDVRERERRENNARTRALWRLAHLHPAQFAALLDDELSADQRRDTPS